VAVAVLNLCGESNHCCSTSVHHFQEIQIVKNGNSTRSALEIDGSLFVLLFKPPVSLCVVYSWTVGKLLTGHVALFAQKLNAHCVC
jgi:hypothetical protein